VQWGCDAVLLNVVDREYNVRKAFVGDLLPAARGKSEAFDTLHTDEQRLLNRLVGLKGRSMFPIPKSPERRSSSPQTIRARRESLTASPTTMPPTADLRWQKPWRCVAPVPLGIRKQWRYTPL
jgi:hypothetical protein